MERSDSKESDVQRGKRLEKTMNDKSKCGNILWWGLVAPPELSPDSGCNCSSPGT
jgi:hypothetical protein